MLAGGFILSKRLHSVAERMLKLTPRFLTSVTSGTQLGSACLNKPCTNYNTMKTSDPSSSSILTKSKYALGMGDLRFPIKQLKAAGENLFAICAEYPVFEDFVEHLGLPDTFQSWFSTTTLHIWLCLVRLRCEGEEAQLVKKRLLDVLWIDMYHRIRSFRVYFGLHKQVMQFRKQFYGTVFAYDEAFMMHSDPAFVSAIWRNLFMCSDSVSAQELELALTYVRKQLEHLDKQPSSVIIGVGAPTLLPLVGSTLDQEHANERLRYSLSWPGHLI